MELKIYVDEIRNLIPEDYKNIDERLIVQTINEHRAVHLKNQFNQKRSIDDVVKQTIFVDLEMIEELEYPVKTTTHRILRSKVAIPKTINRHFEDTITTIRNGLILSEKYNYVTADQAVYAGNGHSNKTQVFIFLYRDKLYVKLQKANPKLTLLRNLAIEGVFEDPREAYSINNTDDSLYMEYPMSITTWQYIKDNIVADLSRTVQSLEYERSKEG